MVHAAESLFAEDSILKQRNTELFKANAAQKESSRSGSRKVLSKARVLTAEEAECLKEKERIAEERRLKKAKKKAKEAEEDIDEESEEQSDAEDDDILDTIYLAQRR